LSKATAVSDIDHHLITRYKLTSNPYTFATLFQKEQSTGPGQCYLSTVLA
jgi:hypothetical protein